jgi:glycosyltransferase involved in cell wall biosynthesis/coenzyme F420-reducing hydrogenase beta subunit/polysaccharide pyruvyl transferase WcaK-like protein
VKQSLSQDLFELIISDDCSTDDSVKVAESFYKKIKNLSILKVEKNSGGASMPRNNGIDAARGDYLFFLDSDDTIGGSTLERAITLADRNDSDTVLVPTYSQTRKLVKKLYLSSLDTDKINLYDRECFVSGSAVSKLFKRGLILENNIRFPTNIRKREDNYFIYKMYAVSDTISIVGNNDLFYNAREHGEDNLSLTPLKPSEARVMITDVLKFIYARPNLDEVRKTILGVRLLSQLAHVRKSDSELKLLAESCGDIFRRMEHSPYLQKYSGEIVNKVLLFSSEKPANEKPVLSAVPPQPRSPSIYSDCDKMFKKRLVLADYLENRNLPSCVKISKLQDVIALFGWHYNNNIGGSLTYFALHQLLRSAGFVVRVAQHTRREKRIPIGTRINYDVVRENYRFTDFYDEKDFHIVRQHANIFVTASDQLWRIKYTGWHPEIFLLGCGDNSVKKIAVATSFGTDVHDFNDEQVDIAAYLLKRFDHISVREPSGVDILNDLGVSGSETILDPVFLCDQQEYENIARKSTLRHESGFMFAYILDADRSKTDLLLRARNKIVPGGKAVAMSIPSKAATWKEFKDVDFLADGTSADFLYNLARADFAVTDSFHGACFCVMFHRPFLVLHNEKRGGARFKLFERLGLADRILKRNQLASAEIDTNIDWATVDDRLNTLREHSFKWFDVAFGRVFPRNYSIVPSNRVDSLEMRLCTGCAACCDICPRKCVSMRADDKGFDHPEINLAGCINCGLCAKVCAVMQKAKAVGNIPNDEKRVFVGYSLDENIRWMSSSGGFFSELATTVFGLCKDVNVYGAAYDDNLNIVETSVDKPSDLPILCQSKYAQSKAAGIYAKIDADLRYGATIFFCGPPCYCGALKKYLETRGTETTALYTTDFICHSANSPKAYKAYLEDIQADMGKIKRIWFKNKETTWRRWSVRVDFENRSEYYLGDNRSDPFCVGFLRFHAFGRPSCSYCNFKRHNRFSDITLGDAWGIALRNQDVDYARGVSVAMINTEKGKLLFEQTLPRLFVEEHAYSEMVKHNAHLERCVRLGAYSDFFYSQLGKKPFSAIIKEIAEMRRKGGVHA